MGTNELDRQISRQHGVVTRSQALALGMTPHAIDWRVRQDAWKVAARGTYVVASSADTWERRVMIAVLASGDGAVASHMTAAALWRLIDARPPLIDITISHARRPARLPRRKLHRTRTLDRTEIRSVSGIPVTSPARTLSDLAGVLNGRALEALLDTALNRRLVSIDALLRNGHRSGAATLRKLALDRRNGVPESELERRFLKLLRSARLPQPSRQVVVGGYRLDFAYVDKRLAIELDGVATHSSKAAFQNDRRRQNVLVLDGWTVLRFTWDDVTRRGEMVIATVERAVSAGGGT